MTDSSDHVLHLLAEADTQPVETDAPPDNGLPPYDTALQADLLEFGPEALIEFGMIVIRDVDKEARWNSGVWYALGNDLMYEYKNGCLILTRPDE